MLDLGLQPLKQRKGIGGSTGETANNVTLTERAYLAGIGFDDGGTNTDLAVAGDDDTTIFTNGQYSRPMPGSRLSWIGSKCSHCICIYVRRGRGNSAALVEQGSS